MIFAGIGFGFHKAAKEQKRLEQGIAIKRMLYLLQGEIRYGFTPLPEAVLKISTKTEKLITTIIPAETGEGHMSTICVLTVPG